MLTSNSILRNKTLHARNKIAHVEFLRDLCRNMLWLVKTDHAGHKEIFCPPKKRAKLETKQHGNNFWKVVISNSLLNALRNLHTSKYKRPHNKPDDGCLWKPAKHKNVRTSKQLRFFGKTQHTNLLLLLTSLHSWLSNQICLMHLVSSHTVHVQMYSLWDQTNHLQQGNFTSLVFE